MGEILDALWVVGFFALVGGGIVGVGIITWRSQQTINQSSADYQQKLSMMNMSCQDSFAEISGDVTVYEASYIEHEPYIITANTTDFLGLCQKWNKTSILYDSFRSRHMGFLGLVTEYSGYLWFDFNDNGIEVQVRLQFKV